MNPIAARWRAAAVAMLVVVAAGAAPAQTPGPPRPTTPVQGLARTSAPATTPSAPRAGPVPTSKRTSPARRRARPAAGPGALATIARANAEARDGPRASAYVNAVLYYDFEPGRLYTIHTSPGFLTAITLKPGEKLIAKALGDTVRWVLGETESGAGEAVQVVVLVKPIRPDLRTNIVLTTDQRTYLIEAVSTSASAYTSALSWTYPQDLARDLAARRERASTDARVAQAASVAEAVPVDRLDFRYRVSPGKGPPPRWTPVRVFDDGARTYIEFPADIATAESPPLFLLGADDRAELVNYRQKGVYYVVDRLIDRAELRLGEKRQSVVRITRLGAGR